MLYVLDVVSGWVPFRVLVVPASQEGPNKYRAPADRDHAVVEFYDRRHDHESELGQFVSCYDLRTLLNRPGGNGTGRLAETGLNLDGGVRDWTVDAGAMRVVLAWLEMLDARGALD
jgi:hypothetical protein